MSLCDREVACSDSDRPSLEGSVIWFILIPPFNCPQFNLYLQKSGLSFTAVNRRIINLF